MDFIDLLDIDEFFIETEEENKNARLIFYRSFKNDKCRTYVCCIDNVSVLR